MASPARFTTGSPSPRKVMATNGLFKDGHWYCNCKQRLPALKLETKNHGRFHGKWFYKCQTQSCGFWLWEDDAQVREKQAVLSNSRSEPAAQNQYQRSERSFLPQTPTKPPIQPGVGLLTPQTDRPRRSNASPARAATPSKSARARLMSEDSDEFEWDEDAASQLLSQTSPPPMRQPDFTSSQPSHSQPAFSYSSPRKTPRTDSITTPGKRKREDEFVFDDDNDAANNSQRNQSNSTPTLTPTSVFSSQRSSQGRGLASTMRNSQVPPASAEICMTPTPSKYRSSSQEDPHDPCDLALQVLTILEGHGTVVPRRAQEEVTAVMNRFEMKMKGVSRGREITRLSLKQKDEEIRRLSERVASLEELRGMEREFGNSQEELDMG